MSESTVRKAPLLLPAAKSDNIPDIGCHIAAESEHPYAYNAASKSVFDQSPIA